MSCSITITGVAGITTGSALSSIQVTGTATDCFDATGILPGSVTVTIRCSMESHMLVCAINPSTGGWNASFLGAFMSCRCDEPILAQAFCTNVPSCIAAPVSIQNLGCPCCDVQITASVDTNCNKGGRVVTFTVTNNCPITINNATLQFGNGSQQTPISFPPGVSTILSNYMPGTYQADLQIPNCPVASVPVTVASCPCCDVRMTVSVDPDCTNGIRLTTINFINSCSASIAGATLDFGDGSTSTLALPVGGSGITHAYVPGGPYQVILHLPGCNDLVRFITVPPCPICCDVTLGQAQFISKGCHDGHRVMTFTITNNCPSSIGNSVVDFGDGTSPQTFPNLSPGPTNVSHAYLPGTYTITLHVPGCPDVTLPITVPPCACCEVQLSATVGANCVDGKRLTTVNFVNNCPGSVSNATIDFGDGSLTTQVPLPLGPSSITHPYVPGGPYAITLHIPGCPDALLSLAVAPCPPCCNVQVSAVVDRECKNGQRAVTFEITNHCTTNIVNASLDFGDSQQVNLPALISGTSANVATHYYSPSNYSATLNIPGCPGIQYHFSVPDCPCPTVTFTHTTGRCQSDGTRPVTYTAVVTGISPTSPINAQLFGPCGPPQSSAGIGTLTLSDSCSLNTGTYTITVVANDCPPKTYTVSVQDCCPSVDFQSVVLKIPLCDGCRNAEVTAVVTPQSGVLTTATLTDLDTNTALASGTGSAPFTLSHSECYSGGTHNLAVLFASPLNCPPQTYSFCVPECESESCFSLRNSLVVALSTFLAIVLINGIAALAGSINSPWFLFGRYLDHLANASGLTSLAFIQSTALATSIALFLFWALCLKLFGVQIGSCCGKGVFRCRLLLTLWQVFLIVGIILLWFLACSWLLNLLFALIMLMIAYLIYFWWKNTCCIGKCDFLFYLVTAVAISAAPITLLESAGLSSHCVNAPNVLSAYPAWYVLLLYIVNMILRLVIGYAVVIYAVRLGKCLGR